MFVCFFLAGVAVDTYFGDDSEVLGNFQNGSIPVYSVFAVGNLRRLFKFGDLFGNLTVQSG